MSELSAEDSLRLNVLLANQPQAIRINESSMVVYGLSATGEAQITLNPTCRDEQYIKRVKELISGHVLGSPGGYPIYLQRWTRMGQMKDDSLEQLLLLGEPEAVVAAVCAQGLTNDLARRAWWAMEDAENARQMLRKQAICAGDMGPVLAAYLIEHLPFEVEAEKQIETIRLVLQPGLLTAEKQDDLWRKAARKPAFYVGFIATCADNIPENAEPHALWQPHVDALNLMGKSSNALAVTLLRVLSAEGQAYIQTLYKIFNKPSNQDVVNITLDEIAQYFSALRAEKADATFEELREEAEQWVIESAEFAEVVAYSAALHDAAIACHVLSGMGYGVVRPVFKDSTAIGSLMRKKLAPMLEALRQYLKAIS